eukprot:jgi/Botrbrau1/10771/Bobra.0119s0001.1
MPNLQQQHVQRVMQLYRQILKNTLNWAVNREVFYAEAARIRGEFDKNKIVPDPATAEALVKRAEAALKENQHPDPYIAPLPPWRQPVRAKSTFSAWSKTPCKEITILIC